MKSLFFIISVSGVGKSTTLEYIKKNSLLDDYSIFDIDDLENINNYNENNYNLFYENALEKAVLLSNDIEKLKIPNEIENYINILITCSNDKLKKRLKSREKSRQCGTNEYIDRQITYQNYLLNNFELFQLHIDNTTDDVENVSKKIVKFIKEVSEI